MSAPIRVGVLGPNGRMGEQVLKLISTEFQKKMTLSASVARKDDPKDLLNSDGVVDFSLPEGLQAYLTAALSKKNSKTNLPILITGTTGLTPKIQSQLKEYSQLAPVLHATNFSLGVMSLNYLLKQAAPLFKALGFEAVVTETHHKHKKDAPSGTAKTLLKIVEDGGYKNIQHHSIRAGEVIGDHAVEFYGNADQVRLSHHAQDRSIFAAGALECLAWLYQKRKLEPGLHGFFDIQTYFGEILKKGN